MEQALQRWPRFARDAQRAGVASYLSGPLSIDERFAGNTLMPGALLNRGASGLVLDMTGTRFCDVAGVRAIVRAHCHAQSVGSLGPGAE